MIRLLAVKTCNLVVVSIGDGLVLSWLGIVDGVAPALAQQHRTGRTGLCVALGVVHAGAEPLAARHS